MREISCRTRKIRLHTVCRRHCGLGRIPLPFKKLKMVYFFLVDLYNQIDLCHLASVRVQIFSSAVTPMKIVQCRFTQRDAFKGHIGCFVWGFAVCFCMYVTVRWKVWSYANSDHCSNKCLCVNTVHERKSYSSLRANSLLLQSTVSVLCVLILFWSGCVNEGNCSRLTACACHSWEMALNVLTRRTIR
jgi:hypothetical protein